MKKYCLSFVFVSVAMLSYAQKIITLSPQVDEQSQEYVTITKVELTDVQTIVHFRYKDRNRGMSESQRRMAEKFGLQLEINSTQIEIDPNIRLYDPKNPKKKFKFIKTLGIPVAPEVMTPKPGQVVNFRVVFERVTPGIEIIDIFEGQDRGERQFWNFYGVHIRNPRQLPKPKVDVAPEAPVVPPAPETPPKPALIVIKGNILDAKTQKPIAAKLNYVLPNPDGSQDSLQLSASSGKFRLSFEPSQSASYTASAKGYFPTNGTFDLGKATNGEATQDIMLTPMTVGTAVTLNRIYFEVSKFDLLPTSYAELDQLAQSMADNPTMEIRVEGHTDNLGDSDENITLSLNRANAVKKYLIEKGIDSARIETKGYGSTRPVTKSTAPTERQKNRRVEFVILKG